MSGISPPRYFQDQLNGNHCYGCGPNNRLGLQLKSYWADDGEEAHAVFHPSAEHCAAPQNFLNGGVIATIMDCHSICTAIAHAYKKAGLEIGQGKGRWFATAKLEITYLRPTPIEGEILLKASVAAETEHTLEIVCSLMSAGKERATAKVVAAAVPDTWITG